MDTRYKRILLFLIFCIGSRSLITYSVMVHDKQYKNVIKEFIKKYPQDNFFLNISPRNELYINFVKDLGFHLIQHTYERDER